MKVRVCYTIDVDDVLRRAIGYQRYDEDRPASREDIQEWHRQNGTMSHDDILSAYERFLISNTEI